MGQDSRMTAIRLPLQIGTSSLWSVARSSVLFPGLVLVGLGLTLIAVLDFDKVGFALGGSVAGAGGCLLYYAYKHIRLALDERPSDVVLDHQGIRVEGGAQHGLALAWSEIDGSRCEVESATDERFVLWRVFVNIPLLVLSIAAESDATITFTEKTPIKRLYVARRQGERMLVAEGDLPIEEESLETLLHTIRSPHWYGSAKKQTAGPEAIVCRNCGATVAPAAEETVACAFCQTPVAIPADVRERVAAAKNLASARTHGFSRLTRLLESQPSAARAAAAIAIAAVPIALAWPIAAFFVLRDCDATGAGAVRFLQLATFPLLLTFGAFLLARGRLTDRFALHAVVVGFGAHDPARPGEPYRCRSCEAALPPAEGSPIVRCIYCNQASVIGLDLRSEARDAQKEQASLEEALSRRTHERWLWTFGSVASLALLALAFVALRGTLSLHRVPKKVAAVVATSAPPPATANAPPTATTARAHHLTEIVRKATVMSTKGAAPFKQSSCTLRVVPLDDPTACRAWLHCGDTFVYGSSTSQTPCDTTDGAVRALHDTSPTYMDNDPMFSADFAKGRATLSDETSTSQTYSVEFHLSPPNPSEKN